MVINIEVLRKGRVDTRTQEDLEYDLAMTREARARGELGKCIKRLRKNEIPGQLLEDAIKVLATRDISGLRPDIQMRFTRRLSIFSADLVREAAVAHENADIAGRLVNIAVASAVFGLQDTEVKLRRKVDPEWQRTIEASVASGSLTQEQRVQYISRPVLQELNGAF